jgi:hypothetical protein
MAKNAGNGWRPREQRGHVVAALAMATVAGPAMATVAVASNGNSGGAGSNGNAGAAGKQWQ